MPIHSFADARVHVQEFFRTVLQNVTSISFTLHRGPELDEKFGAVLERLAERSRVINNMVRVLRTISGQEGAGSVDSPESMRRRSELCGVMSSLDEALQHQLDLVLNVVAQSLSRTELWRGTEHDGGENPLEALRFLLLLKWDETVTSGDSVRTSRIFRQLLDPSQVRFAQRLH